MTSDDIEMAFLEYKNAAFSFEDWRKAAASLKPIMYEAKAEQDRLIRKAEAWGELARAALLYKQVRAEARRLAEIAGRALGRHVSITELFDFV